MNYLPFVSWGFYGAVTATQTANFYVSWGLLADIPEPSDLGLVSMLLLMGLGR